MGIPRYFKFIKGRFPLTVKAANLEECTKIYHHLYFDVNNLLYGRISNTTSHYVLFYRLFSYLDRIYKFARPQETMFLAVDGPGPKAKIITQRSRRLEKASASSYSPQEAYCIDPLQFTPGTSFMEELKQGLCYYAGRRTLHSRGSLKVYVCGADDAGEGELKLFEHMKTLIQDQENKPKKDPLAFLREKPLQNKPKAKCMIVGNDADLIVFSLLHSHLFDIDILKCENNLEHVLLDIPLLRQQIIQEVFGSSKVAPTQDEEQTVVEDFALLSLFIGNDYLPRMKQFSFGYVWNAYCVLRRKKYRNTSLWLHKTGLSQADVPAKINQVFFQDIYEKSMIAAQCDRMVYETHQNPKLCSQFWLNEIKNVSFTYQTLPGESQSGLETLFGSEGVFVGLYANEELISRGYGLDEEQAKINADISAIPKLKQLYNAYLVETNTQPDLKMQPYLDEPISDNSGFDPVTPEEHSLRLQLYLQGIAWIMEYFSGRCLDYSYVFPFSSGPTFEEFVKNPALLHPVNAPKSNDMPLNPIEFLLSVSPLEKCSSVIHPQFSEMAESLPSEFVSVSSSPIWRKDISALLENCKSVVSEYIGAHTRAHELREVNQLAPALMFTTKPDAAPLVHSGEVYYFNPPSTPEKQNFDLPRSGVVCLASMGINNRSARAFSNPNNPFMIRKQMYSNDQMNNVLPKE